MCTAIDITSRGCFFCRSGKEAEIAQRFRSAFPDAKAIFPTCTRYRRSNGKAVEELVPLLPGYVFFEIKPMREDMLLPLNETCVQRTKDVENALLTFSRTVHMLNLLRYTNQDWRLHGSDDAFAKLLFDTEGNIDISQAYFDEGNRIRILGGFLKDYEGCITRVNRRTRTVEVSVNFHEKNVRMWLGYELVETARRWRPVTDVM